METGSLAGSMRNRLLAFALAAATCGFGADRKLSAVIVDGVNNHDWAAGTSAIKTILEGTGRFTVDIRTYPKLPEFSVRANKCVLTEIFSARFVSYLPENEAKDPVLVLEHKKAKVITSAS